MLSENIKLDFSPKLDFFLVEKFKGKSIELPFRENQTYKHIIESLGIPHTEIGQITIKNQVIDINSISRRGDHVKILSVLDGERSGNRIIGPRFILDNHLGKLSRYLRMLGFDCLYDNQCEDKILALRSHEENRILLTRDRRLLMRSIVESGYCIRSFEPVYQLQEVVGRFELRQQIQLFGRCPICNSEIVEIPKDMIVDRLEPLTRKYFSEFKICKACGKIYWKGSHIKKILEILEPILSNLD